MKTAAAIVALILAFSAAMAKEGGSALPGLTAVPELDRFIRCWTYVAYPGVINDLIDYTVDGTLPGKETCAAVNKASDDGFCIPDMFLIWQEKYGYYRDHPIQLEKHCKQKAH